MGISQTKSRSSSSRTTERAMEDLKNKVGVLQGEINEIMRIRDAENQAYEQELMVFAFKQAEWKRERKRLKEQVRKLCKTLEDQKKHEQDHHHDDGDDEYDRLMDTSSCMLEQIKEEQKRRDQTVEKWKQLYFAIKIELDHLIQRTNQEERVCWKRSDEDDDIIMELKREVKAKEERIEILQEKLASLEHQQSQKEREMDILRQSLRIMSHKRRAAARLGQRRSIKGLT